MDAKPSRTSHGLTREVLFHAIARLEHHFTTLILAALGHSAGASALIGVVSSVVALVWNMIFNTVFERWEERSGITGRPVKIRLLHTFLFESGLVVVLVPLVALILQVSLWEALLYEAGLIGDCRNNGETVPSCIVAPAEPPR